MIEMKTNTPKSKKLYWNICMIGSTIVTVIIVIYFGLHWYWKKNITEEIGYTRIDTVIATIGVPINILTILFVALAYRSQNKQINEQKEQIKKNDRETEFSRVLDIIYRQLPNTLEAIKSHHYSRLYQIISDNYKTDVEKERYLLDHIESGNVDVQYYLLIVTQHLGIFNYILDNNNLTSDKRDYVRQILWANIGASYEYFVTTLLEYSDNIYEGQYENLLKEIRIFFTKK